KGRVQLTLRELSPGRVEAQHRRHRQLHPRRNLDTLFGGDWLGRCGERRADAGAAVPVGEPPGCNITGAVGRLARLSRIKYETQREDEAGRLGIRVSVLDRLVDRAGRKTGEDDVRPGQGRSVEIPEAEPWSAPVNGAELLDGITKALHRY